MEWYEVRDDEQGSSLPGSRQLLPHVFARFLHTITEKPLPVAVFCNNMLVVPKKACISPRDGRPPKDGFYFVPPFVAYSAALEMLASDRLPRLHPWYNCRALAVTAIAVHRTIATAIDRRLY